MLDPHLGSRSLNLILVDHDLGGPPRAFADRSSTPLESGGGARRFVHCSPNARKTSVLLSIMLRNIGSFHFGSMFSNVSACCFCFCYPSAPLPAAGHRRPSLLRTYGRTIFIVTNLNFTLLSAAHPGASGECFCFSLIPIFLALICGSGSQQVGASIHRFTLLAAAHPDASGKCFCFCCSLSFLLELEALLEARHIYTSRRIFCLKNLKSS